MKRRAIITCVAAMSAVLHMQAKAQATQAAAKPLSVCELLQNLESHSGQLVEVRGEIHVSRHGWTLGQSGCSSAVYVSYSGSPRIESPRTLQVDKEAIRRMERILCFLNESSQNELGVRISATFVGELRTPEITLPPPFGKSRLARFGQFGLPAELVVTSVRGIVVEQVDVPGK